MPKTTATVLQVRDRTAKNLGAAFRRVRAELDLTQAQLAAHLEVSTASISAVEHGKQLVTLERLLLFCDLFGRRPDEVLLGEQA